MLNVSIVDLHGTLKDMATNSSETMFLDNKGTRFYVLVLTKIKIIGSTFFKVTTYWQEFLEKYVNETYPTNISV